MIFLFFDCLSPFCFLFSEFHCTFSISYKILRDYVQYSSFIISYKILRDYVQYSSFIRIVQAVRTSFFFSASFTSCHTHAFLLTLCFCYIILFHSCCSHARVFGKTFVHEFHISYSHTEWYLFFLQCNTSAQCVFGAKNQKQLSTSKPEPLN